MPELSISSSTFTAPIIALIDGNDAFNQFFSIVFYFGGISYFCGAFVRILNIRG